MNTIQYYEWGRRTDHNFATFRVKKFFLTTEADRLWNILTTNFPNKRMKMYGVISKYLGDKHNELGFESIFYRDGNDLVFRPSYYGYRLSLFSVPINSFVFYIGDYIFGSTVVKFDGDIYIQNRKLKKTAFSSHSLVFSQTAGIYMSDTSGFLCYEDSMETLYIESMMGKEIVLAINKYSVGDREYTL